MPFVKAEYTHRSQHNKVSTYLPILLINKKRDTKQKFVESGANTVIIQEILICSPCRQDGNCN